ncbi:MAG: EF-P lysine aminoacylase GenX, partial [Proteobacteria bacterium]|nr:EF-P lysine aminoacylase GenX [Pseudomonadota bacterium]
DQAFIRTSPEFFLKRLLASGVGDVYEIGQVFRQSEYGKIHNPEFTMLEWYRLNFTLENLMEEVECLLRFLLKSFGKQAIQFRYKTYQQIYQQYLKIDPFSVATTDLNKLCEEHTYTGDGLTYNESLDFLFSVVIQPQLPSDEGLFIYHFPATQAALAQIHPDKKHLSLRFELLWKNIELANGYRELTCADELKRRFDEDNVQRLQSNKQVMPMDVNLLAAMSSGLPACSGVAIGLDRLFMNLIDKKELSAVLGFDANNS